MIKRPNTKAQRAKRHARVRGKISVQRHKLYKGKGPVLKITSVVLTDAPEQEVATFY